MDARVLRVNLPNADFAVLVTGVDLLTGDDYGFNQAAVGFESAELLEILPDTDVLAVGAGVEQFSGGGEGVDVSLFTDEGTDEAVERQDSVVKLLGPRGLGIRRGLVPRRHQHGRALAAHTAGVVAHRRSLH